MQLDSLSPFNPRTRLFFSCGYFHGCRRSVSCFFETVKSCTVTLDRNPPISKASPRRERGQQILLSSGFISLDYSTWMLCASHAHWSFDIKPQSYVMLAIVCGAGYLLLLDLASAAGLALKLKVFFFIASPPLFFFLPFTTV